MRTLVVISDTHCGSTYGLCPPQYISTNPHHNKLQREAWRAYKQMVVKWYRPDILLVNGDCIEGRQDRQGGAELLTNDRNVQAEMAMECIEQWDAKKILMSYGCLTAGHRILTEKLEWIPVEQLKKGDIIAGFEEEPKEKLKRKWVKSEVLSNVPFMADVYRIKLSDGTFLEATGEHPFLIKTPSRKYYWRTVEELSRGIKKNGRGWVYFSRILPVWDTLKSYEAGYLSGFFDGEGCCSQRLKENRSGWQERQFSVSATQKDNEMLATAKKYLTQFSIKFSIANHYTTGEEIFNLDVRGGLYANVKFLGSIRPPRLLKKFDFSKLGSIRTSYKDKTKIIGIEPIGKKEVWGLSTSSKTYVSEGFLSHNTAYHSSSQAEDFEYNIADKVGATIEGRLFFEVEDMMIDARHKVASSIVPYGRATPLIRDMVWNSLKSAENEEPRANLIIRSHTHYHLWVETPNKIMFTTPALQLSRGRFGSRECVGETHWGAIRLKINKGQIVGKEVNVWKLIGQRQRIIKIK